MHFIPRACLFYSWKLIPFYPSSLICPPLTPVLWHHPPQSVLCFYELVWLVCFYLTCISEVIWYLSFSIWLISISIVMSGSIHVVINDIFHFFIWLNNVPLWYACVSIYHVFKIKSSVDTKVVFMSWLLYIVLQRFFIFLC